MIILFVLIFDKRIRLSDYILSDAKWSGGFWKSYFFWGREGGEGGVAGGRGGRDSGVNIIPHFGDKYVCIIKLFKAIFH